MAGQSRPFAEIERPTSPAKTQLIQLSAVNVSYECSLKRETSSRLFDMDRHRQKAMD